MRIPKNCNTKYIVKSNKDLIFPYLKDYAISFLQNKYNNRLRGVLHHDKFKKFDELS